MLQHSGADFPGGPVVKNPPTNAGDVGLIFYTKRFHVLQSNKAHEPQLLILALEPVLFNKRSPHNEKPMNRNEE